MKRAPVGGSVVRARVLMSGVLLACVARSVESQGNAPDVSTSAWLWRWSALRGVGELGLPRPRGGELPRLLELPAPRLGLAFGVGNPAGLHDDIDSAYTRVVAGAGGVSGTYRLPLEPLEGAGSGVGMSAWRRVGERVAAAGRVAVEREAMAAGTPAAFTAPYGSSPYVPADTNRPALRRPIVVIEGGEATAFGAWRVGVAAGFRLLENNSVNSAAALLGRGSTAGLTIGASRRVGATAQLGVHVRRLSSHEAVNLIPNPRTVRVYALDGYVGVQPSDYSPGIPPFFRRVDRTGDVAGVGAVGRTLGVTWSAYGEWQRLRERQVFAVALNAPVDLWRTDGFALGGAAQRALFGVQATVRGDWTAQEGVTERATVRGGDYTADASAVAFLADLRPVRAAAGWLWGVVGGVARDRQAVDDRGARATSDIRAWRPHLGGEVGRAVNERVTLVAGYAVSGYTPHAGIPSPNDRERSYRTLIAPAMEVAAAGARSDRVSAAGRLRLAGREVALGAWRETLRPGARPSDPEIPLPRGRRVMWGVGIGVGRGAGGGDAR